MTERDHTDTHASNGTRTPQVTQSIDWLDSDRLWAPDIVDIVELPSFTMVVKDHRGPIELLPATIQEFVAQRQAWHLHPSISRTFNLNYRRTPDAEGNWHIGVAMEVPNELKAEITAVKMPEGFRLHLFGSGEYARIRVQGGEAGLMFAANWLIEQWLPHSRYDMAEGITLFERVKFPPLVEPTEALVDILVPVEMAI